MGQKLRRLRDQQRTLRPVVLTVITDMVPGAHGGIMVSLGRDSYHVEAVIDSEGAVRLYTLGKDESRVIAVESQTLNGFVKAEGDSDSKRYIVRGVSAGR